jgi:thiamine-phosphate pyrophosphorylase
MKQRKLAGGLYLVVDPAVEIQVLLPKIEQAIEGGITVLQVWNHWNPHTDKEAVVNAICRVAHAQNVPVLINDEWSLLQTTSLDGVHFDALPHNLGLIRQSVLRPFLLGITCGNDLGRIEWANSNGCDYVSFCAMFPSASAGTCELVSIDTVRQARAMTSLPIFLAGGITQQNLQQLSGTGMNGVALIAAVMNADDPKRAAKNFVDELKSIEKK